jgi:hypothetical protein
MLSCYLGNIVIITFYPYLLPENFTHCFERPDFFWSDGANKYSIRGVTSIDVSLSQLLNMSLAGSI